MADLAPGLRPAAESLIVQMGYTEIMEAARKVMCGRDRPRTCWIELADPRIVKQCFLEPQLCCSTFREAEAFFGNTQIWDTRSSEEAQVRVRLALMGLC